jgi:leader peptidase (prepilin peptidase)/N-methyltransferase
LAIFTEHIIVVFVGLVLGSFATALIYRSPRDIPWHGIGKEGRSACTHCKTILTLRDLVPLFSWLASRGRCRTCGQKIGAVYPLTELVVLLACLGVYWSWGFSIEAGLLMLCIPFLVALVVIDLQFMILPDALVVIAGLLGLVRLGLGYFYDHSLVLQDVWDGLAGGVGYGAFAWILTLVMNRVLKKEAMGFGDVKFFAAAGLWLGLSQLGTFCILSGFLGVALALAWKAMKKGDIFPFGPALIMSLYLLLILPSSFFPETAINY